MFVCCLIFGIGVSFFGGSNNASRGSKYNSEGQVQEGRRKGGKEKEGSGGRGRKKGRKKEEEDE